MFIILPNLKRILWIPAIMAVIMMAAAFSLDESELILPFLIMLVVSLGVQGFIRVAERLSPFSIDDPSTGDHLATAATAWIIVPAIGAVPLLLAATVMPAAAAYSSVENSIFEAFSGFTSTGMTMSANPSELPKTIQLWRTLMEWVGGLGIALFMLILINPKSDGGDLSSAELSVEFGDSPRRTGLVIGVIYATMSLVACVALWLAGMPGWEALNHGLTAISTGGFSVTDQSVSQYSPLLQALIAGFFYLGALSFGFYLALSRRSFSDIKTHLRPLFGFLVVSVLATGLLVWSQSQFSSESGLLTALFQVLSALATAGFSTTTLGDWHSAPLMILVICMIIGGCSGSTAGGVKIDRIVLVLRGIVWRVRRLFTADDARVRHEIDGDVQRERKARLQVESASTMIGIWVGSLFLGCLALAPLIGDDWNFTQLAFEVASAQGGVGLSVGITGDHLPLSAKCVLIVLMWAGRLELIAVLALFAAPFKKTFR